MPKRDFTPILERRARVLIFAENDSVGIDLERAVKELRFNEVARVRAFTDCYNSYTSNGCDWAIIASEFNGEGGAEEALKILVGDKSKDRPLLSGFLSLTQQKHCPKLTVLGLDSWHVLSEDTTQCRSSLQSLINNLAIAGCSRAKLAAMYIREYLYNSGDYSKLVDFDLSVIDRFHNDPRLLLNLAQSQYLKGNLHDAVTLLIQTKNMDPRLSDEISSLYTLVKTALESRAGKDQKRPQAEEECCVIIDGDSSVCHQATEVLKGFGFDSLRVFSDGKEAWNELSKMPEPALILMEWRLRGINGPFLAQRVRNHQFNRVPIIVCSSKVPREEMVLLRELSVAHLIKKPFGARELSVAIKWSLQQHQRPSHQAALEKEISLAIKRNDWSLAKNLKAAYLSNQKVFESRKKLVTAEFLYGEGRYQDALKVALAAAKAAELESIDLMDLVARCYEKTGDDSAASKFYSVAHKISPSNVGRLCEMSEVSSRLGLEDLAKKQLAMATALDCDNQVVIEVELKNALVSDDISRVDGLTKRASNKSQLVARLNNWAVSFSKKGRPTEAIKIYEKILGLLTSDQLELKARISYNLSLSLIRVGKTLDASRILRTTGGSEFPLLAKKIASLRERLDAAIKMGTKSVLISNVGQDNSDPPAQGIGTSLLLESILQGEIDDEPLNQISIPSSDSPPSEDPRPRNAKGKSVA